MQKISPCLWFDDKAEEAAKFMPPFKTLRLKDWLRYPLWKRRIRDSWKKGGNSNDCGF